MYPAFTVWLFLFWPDVPASGLFQIDPHLLALLFGHYAGLPVRVPSVAVRVQRAVFDLTSISLASIPA